jgi:hypothetical protein
VPADPGSIRSTAYLIPEKLAYKIYKSEYDTNSSDVPDQYGKLEKNISVISTSEASSIYFK